MATFIVSPFTTPFITKNITIKKGMSINSLKPIHVLPMIIKSHWLTRIRNRSMLICLLGLPLRNIWFCTRINVRILLLSFLLLIVISLRFWFVHFKEHFWLAPAKVLLEYMLGLWSKSHFSWKLLAAIRSESRNRLLLKSLLIAILLSVFVLLMMRAMSLLGAKMGLSFASTLPPIWIGTREKVIVWSSRKIERGSLRVLMTFTLREWTRLRRKTRL